jgi:hypothetical protein
VAESEAIQSGIFGVSMCETTVTALAELEGTDSRKKPPLVRGLGDVPTDPLTTHPTETTGFKRRT